MTKEELKANRKALGMTQESLAEELGVHVRTVSKWERGVHKVPGPVAAAVIEFLEAKK